MPEEFVVPEDGVSELLPVGVRDRLTVLPETGLPAPSLSVTVMVDALTPSAATDAGDASTVDREALTANTLRLALAALADTALLEDTVPVLLVLVPVLVAVTSVVMLQLPFAGMVPPLSVSEEPPAEAVRVPAQLLEVASGDAFLKPLGKLSLKATPVSAELLELVSVIVLVLLPFTPMDVGLKLVETVGAAFEKVMVLLCVQVLLVSVTVTDCATVLVAVMLMGAFLFSVWV